MPFWKPPELPKAERMPAQRTKKGPSYGARMLAGVAGIAFGSAALMGLMRGMSQSSGGRGPLMSLALLIPTVVLLRYALTGVIKR